MSGEKGATVSTCRTSREKGSNYISRWIKRQYGQMSEGDVGSAGSTGVPGTDELLSVASESSETSVKDKHPKRRQAFPELSDAASELG